MKLPALLQISIILFAIVFISSCSKKGSNDVKPQLLTVTTIAGDGKSGSADGKGNAASFSSVWGIKFDHLGNLYVTDGRILRKISADGTVSFVAGSNISPPTNPDGKGSAAYFDFPKSIAVDPSNNIYVADYNMVRKVTPDGTVTTVPGSISPGGLICQYAGIVLDAAGNIYASDVEQSVIVKISTDGTAVIFAGNGAGAGSSVDGKGTAASFAEPTGLAMDASGNLFVVDAASDEIRKVTPDGTVTTIAGSGLNGAVDGKGSAASFYDPTGVVVDASGNLYIGDYGNYKIRKITPDGTVSTIAGSGVEGYADGIGIKATFGGPEDLTLDASGNLYVADYYNVRKITL